MSILREIAAAKRERVRALKRAHPLSSLRAEPLYREERRSLARALRRGNADASPEYASSLPESGGHSPVDRGFSSERGAGQAQERPHSSRSPEESIRFLCEIKRASPSAGWIREDADAVRIATLYAEAGASAISLLTEEQYFRGRLEDLPGVRAVGLPVLMKDFFIDPFQVELARAKGADALLLIAALEDVPLFEEIRAAARELGIEVLVEVHQERECELAHRLDPELAGVNNRDLASFEVDLAVSERLRGFLPASAVALSESGIRTRADVERLARAGFDGLLVGESLMRADDPGDALRTLRGAVPDER